MSTRSSTTQAALQPRPPKASPLPTTVSRVLPATTPATGSATRRRRRRRCGQRGGQALLYEAPVEQAPRLAESVGGVEDGRQQTVPAPHRQGNLAVPGRRGPARLDADCRRIHREQRVDRLQREGGVPRVRREW